MEIDQRDRELYEQLLGYLMAEGSVEEQPGTGVVVIRAFDHRDLSAPLRLHITPRSFGDHLRRTAAGSNAVYPDVGPIEASWRLFTVHLMEAVETAKPGETDLVLDPSGVVPRRP